MFEVMKHPCQNCLYTEDRIVSPERAEGIIRQCNEKSGHFICHVASIRGQDICCHNFYKNMENKKVRLAKAWGLTRFVDMRKFDSRKKSWKELEGDKPTMRGYVPLPLELARFRMGEDVFEGTR